MMPTLKINPVGSNKSIPCICHRASEPPRSKLLKPDVGSFCLGESWDSSFRRYLMRDFKQVPTFPKASNKLPPLASTLKASTGSGHHVWLTPAPKPCFIHRWPALAEMQKCCCPGWLSEHPAFVVWDRDGEYKTELAQLKRWWAQCGLSKAEEKCSSMQIHGCSCWRCVCVHDSVGSLPLRASLPLNPAASPAYCIQWLWDLLALREELRSRLDWFWDWQRRRSRSKSINCCDFRGR